MLMNEICTAINARAVRLLSAHLHLSRFAAHPPASRDVNGVGVYDVFEAGNIYMHISLSMLFFCWF